MIDDHALLVLNPTEMDYRDREYVILLKPLKNLVKKQLQ